MRPGSHLTLSVHNFFAPDLSPLVAKLRSLSAARV